MNDYDSLSFDALPHNRGVVIAALKHHGIQQAIVHYEGAGDSGGAERVELDAEDKQPLLNGVKVQTLTPEGHFNQDKRYVYDTVAAEISLHDALCDLAMTLLEQHEPGWENNGGGEGTFTIEVDTGLCRLEHTTFYTESSTNEYTLP